MPHAQARAEAMLLRDRRAEEAGAPSAADWHRINELLNVSWNSLRVHIAKIANRQQDTILIPSSTYFRAAFAIGLAGGATTSGSGGGTFFGRAFR